MSIFRIISTVSINVGGRTSVANNASGCCTSVAVVQSGARNTFSKLGLVNISIKAEVGLISKTYRSKVGCKEKTSSVIYLTNCQIYILTRFLQVIHTSTEAFSIKTDTINITVIGACFLASTVQGEVIRASESSCQEEGSIKNLSW